MAFAKVAASALVASASTDSMVIAVPEGVAAGDLLVAHIYSYAAAAPSSLPAGWALAVDSYYAATYLQAVYYKVAGASEPANYTWPYAAANKRSGYMIAYRGDYNTADPILDSADSEYITSNQTVRAGSVTVEAGSPIIWAAGVYDTAARTFTPPSGWADDFDAGSTDSDIWVTMASTVAAAAGETGNIDGGISNSETSKIAVAIALKPYVAPVPAAGGPSRSQLRRLRSRRTRR